MKETFIWAAIGLGMITSVLTLVIISIEIFREGFEDKDE